MRIYFTLVISVDRDVMDRNENWIKWNATSFIVDPHFDFYSYIECCTNIASIHQIFLDSCPYMVRATRTSYTLYCNRIIIAGVFARYN